MISGLITLLPILLGLLLLAAAIWEFMTWRTRFTDWSNGMGTSLGAAKDHGDVGPRLAYEYNIDGISYKGVSTYMKDALPEKGEGIHIYYDPANPANSEWYDGGMHRFFMFGVGAIGVLVLWLAI